MNKVVLIRYSEIAVKGPRTRRRMEELLIHNILEALRSKGAGGEVLREQGRIIVKDPKPDSESVSKIVSKVFGVKSVSPAVLVKFKDLDDLIESSLEFFKEKVNGKVFAVRVRRTGKHSFTSKDVERILGELLLKEGGRRVDLENPEYVARIEIRENRAFLYEAILRGPGGLPLGSEDPVLVLYSGGFDSSVSAWLLMKRGSPVSLMFFYFGLDRALEIATEIANYLKEEWSHGRDITFYLVDFRDIIDLVSSNVRRDYRVLVLRRLMAEVSESIANWENIPVLATGESIGQVASQTVNNLRLIWEGIRTPVLRPVVGLDKDEVTELAREIGIYDIASRQIETCKRLGSPDPRASAKVFRSELENVRSAVSDIFKRVKYYKFSLGRLELKKLLDVLR